MAVCRIPGSCGRIPLRWGLRHERRRSAVALLLAPPCPRKLVSTAVGLLLRGQRGISSRAGWRALVVLLLLRMLLKCLRL